jgi:undecaprenyl-diphosphatase
VTRRRRGFVAGALLAFGAFGFVVQQVFANGPLVDLDRHLADHFSAHRLGRARSIDRVVTHGRLVDAARVFSPLGEAVLLIGIGAIAALLLVNAGRRRSALFVTVAVVGGIVLDVFARTIIGHARPDLPFPYFVISRFGLPSGHALDATVGYGALLIVGWPMVPRVVRVVGLSFVAGLVVAVSASRVILLTHYLSDVLAGMALGLAWLLALAAAFSLPERDRLPPAA